MGRYQRLRCRSAFWKQEIIAAMQQKATFGSHLAMPTASDTSRVWRAPSTVSPKNEKGAAKIQVFVCAE
jgi:hypothetical protein